MKKCGKSFETYHSQQYLAILQHWCCSVLKPAAKEKKKKSPSKRDVVMYVRKTGLDKIVL